MADGRVPTWEKRYPGRVAYEYAALRHAIGGGEIRVDDAALDAGIWVLEFSWPLNGQQIPLRAVFPAAYPHVRPLVYLLSNRSTFPDHHVSPLEGNICLIGRDGRQWIPSLTLAKLLQDQLEDALTGNANEDPQGEPAEYWWNHISRPGKFILVDSGWDLKGVEKGTLVLSYQLARVDGEPSLQGVVQEVRDQNDKVVAEWSGTIPHSVVSNAKTARIPWSRVNETLLPNGSGEQLLELRSLVGEAPRLPMGAVNVAQLFAVNYPAELEYQKTGDAWLFPILFGPKRTFKKAKGANKPTQQPRASVVATLRAGSDDIGVRAPAVKLLKDKKVAIVGGGAIGAPIAVELARNGCEDIRLLDHDIIEPGNSIRWPIGASAWGQKKVLALKTFIEQEYPRTTISPFDYQVGSYYPDKPELSDDVQIGLLLDGADIVIDAAVSYGVSTYLAQAAAAARIPMISAYATPPLTGGGVTLFLPNSGCPICLEAATSRGDVPKANGMGDESGLLQPPGCSERTFSGASFDLAEISLQVIRTMMGVFTHPEKYGESLAMLVSLDSDSSPVMPVWSAYPLKRENDCSCAKPQS